MSRRAFLERSRELSRLEQTRRTDTRRLVENWRRSVVGLIKLAEKNLRIAEEYYLKVGNYRRTVEAAFTSVENVSRALIHCYGGKPDPNRGQEEALKLLSQRLTKEERAEFEKANDNFAHLRDQISFPFQVQYVSPYNLQIRVLDEVETKGILESASDVVRLFTRIITDHFATEIPELDEICPSCHSVDSTVSCFSNEKVKYQ